MKEVNDLKTVAPDPDALNYITILKTRKQLTTNDLDIAMQKYGNNYACYKALQDISSDRHIPMNYKNDTDDIEETLLSTRRDFDNINVFSCERGHASAGAVAFQSMFIDNIQEE